MNSRKRDNLLLEKLPGRSYGRWVMSRPLKHRVLVVDDEENIRVVFAQLLQRERYEVAAAENGFDALLKLKQFVPDVIVSDLNMPKMSGFEFLSVVRRRFPKISVIASSGAYGSRVVPTGVLADGFYAKGQDRPGLDSAECEARLAVANAAEEWEHLNHKHTGTEHLSAGNSARGK